MRKTRIFLCFFCAGLTAALAVFIWIMMDASSNPMSGVLRNSLLLVAGITIVSQTIYALKGQIFEYDGSLARRELLFIIIFFQCVMQFGFGFSLYAVNQSELQNDSYDSAYTYFVELRQMASGNSLADFEVLDLQAEMPECVELVELVPAEAFGDAGDYFRFPLRDGGVQMKKAQVYFQKHLQDFAISLLMSLVISVLLMIELVYFATKALDNRSTKLREASPVGYLRQIAFLFYFAGFLGSSFVPLMAKELSGASPNANFIAGLPYSVEALMNCAAILFATPIFRRRGWKPPYAVGVGIFVLGLALSALSGNVYMFIASRAVVGIGYGLCWMTLRNVATVSGDHAENFAGLVSGIYAGIMCGAAFGAVLADKIGYNKVLLLSAVMSLVAAAFPIMLKNQGKTDVLVEKTAQKQSLAVKDILVFAIFMLIVVIPTCISEAFGSYVSPLYVSGLGLPTAYVGRVSLVYNLCLVYLGAGILIKLVRRFIKNGLFQSIFYMLMISAALFAATLFAGMEAMFVASMIFGCGDGFGFSVQNAYVLDTKVAHRIGRAQMLTYLSLYEKFGAMLGPVVFGWFLTGGMLGLRSMGALYLGCGAVCVFLITLIEKTTTKRAKC